MPDPNVILLQASGLAAGPPGGPVVLRSVDLRLAAGDWVALVGGNGSGKSTLLRTLAGLQPLRSGSLTLDGRPIGAWSPRERARRLAVVLTGAPFAPGLRVADFLALGRYPYRDWTGRDPHEDAVVRDVLVLLELGHLAERPFSGLSDGERQRVLLGRALVQEAPLLLLDEPTHHLDPAQAARLRHLLRRWHEAAPGRSVVLATHDLEWAFGEAGRVGVLVDGTVHWGDAADWRQRSHLLNRAFRAPGVAFDPARWRFSVPVGARTPGKPS
jgi:iron complex transport system ATP-binding protein